MFIEFILVEHLLRVAGALYRENQLGGGGGGSNREDITRFRING